MHALALPNPFPRARWRHAPTALGAVPAAPARMPRARQRGAIRVASAHHITGPAHGAERALDASGGGDSGWKFIWTSAGVQDWRGEEKEQRPPQESRRARAVVRAAVPALSWRKLELQQLLPTCAGWLRRPRSSPPWTGGFGRWPPVSPRMSAQVVPSCRTRERGLPRPRFRLEPRQWGRSCALARNLYVQDGVRPSNRFVRASMAADSMGSALHASSPAAEGAMNRRDALEDLAKATDGPLGRLCIFCFFWEIPLDPHVT